jgi:hypothetical protein
MRRANALVWPLLALSLVATALVFSLPARSREDQDLGGPLTLTSTPVPLDPTDPSVSHIGAFRYAGGLVLTAPGTDALHGLSDLEITEDDRLIAVSDFGVLIEATLSFDSDERLVGLSNGQAVRLVDLEGRPLRVKSESDAEGLAVLASGERLVSFEEHDRVWAYQPTSARPRALPMPPTTFAFNQAMEALSADPDAGADAYVVGVEESGDIWSCGLARACVWESRVPKAREFGLVAVRKLPGGLMASLLRAFDLVRGSRIVLTITRDGAVAGQLELAKPLTVDNFEGLAAVRRPGGATRFYLLSDDNASAGQRTLLLAFEWQ